MSGGDAAKPKATALAEPYAGLQAQALGLAEAAGLDATATPLEPGRPWRWIPARMWPDPLRAASLAGLPDGPVIAAGGMAAVVGAALRRPGRPVIQVQHPRMDPARFDLVVVNRHDGLSGPNVVSTRTALHRATPQRLAMAAGQWRERFSGLPRPLVAALIGGGNGRFRLDAATAKDLGRQLAAMMRADQAGLVLTPSRRTSAEAIAALRAALEPEGAWIWDMQGDNPYFGMLALADVIVATEDSVSMVSEAAATRAPVLLAALPGRSRRIRLFNRLLQEDGRVRPFAGRLEMWAAEPMDDTAMAGAEARRRLGL